MNKRLIGNIEVSAVGMGCMGFSHGYGRIPEKKYSIDTICKAHEYGCTFFDTAEGYGAQLYYAGHNEDILGEAVKDFRHEVVLATKFHLAPEDYTAGNDLYKAVKGHLTHSMKRLQTDYVDLYYLHRQCDAVPVEDVAAVMGRLIKDGLIRGWGVSQVSVDTLRRAHEVTPVSAVQNLYNILERDCEEDIFPYCLANNIGVVPFSPVASGFLSGKITVSTEFEKVDDVRNWVPQLSRENIAANQPILDVIKVFAERKSATMAQISMAWMLHKYPNCVPIPGSKNLERVLENLETDEISFAEEEFAELENELKKYPIHGHRGHVEEKQGSGFLDKEPHRNI